MKDGTGRTKQVETLVRQATDALNQSAWFDAEAAASKAMSSCRARTDWDMMIELALILREARKGRRGSSLVKGTVRILDEDIPEDMEFTAGRYLVQPPRVGADARRVRLQCLEDEIPVLVVCREPTTSSGLVPIVSIAPGTTVRTKIKPPSNERKPTAAWFQSALDALAEAAMERIDPAQDVERRIDAILGCLDAVPDSDPLHDMLADACREARDRD